MRAYYGESYIVQGVGFDIHEGEIVALLGRNGAGKTSTLRTIARLDSPQLTHGEIWLDHQPLHQMNAFQASRLGVGFVPERSPPSTSPIARSFSTWARWCSTAAPRTSSTTPTCASSISRSDAARV